MSWWAVYVTDPERFARAKGEPARQGELYLLTPALGNISDAEHARQGLSRRELPGRPDLEWMQWDEAACAFVSLHGVARWLEAEPAVGRASWVVRLQRWIARLGAWCGIAGAAYADTAAQPTSHDDRPTTRDGRER